MSLPRLLGVLVFALGCADGGSGPSPQTPDPSDWLLRDVTTEAGLQATHDTGADGTFYFPEIMGPGVALLDIDDDGDLDLYQVQSGPWREGGQTAASGDRLWRNEGPAADGGPPIFRDVTESIGLVATGYGMAVAAGDIDNDGRVDLYVANAGPNQLWRQGQDGRWAEAAATSGADDPAWSVGAAFVDIDADGWLDLYVVNYVDARPTERPQCRAPSSHPDYCGPQNFRGVADRLLHNRGDGTFEDISGSSGIASRAGRGLGVVPLDADGDDLLDLYVANDLERNFLWRNRGDGTFEDIALLAGCAVNAEGRAEASMGLVALDLDGDGDEDLFSTHLRGETNTLYRNEGNGAFTDVSTRVGAGAPSVGSTGFGAAAMDVDLDGRLDLVIANGAVTRIEDAAAGGDPYPYGEPNQVLLGQADGTFAALPSERLDSTFTRAEVSRGLAVGDIDNDGALDVAIANNRGLLRLYRNQAEPASDWFGLDVRTANGRPALGARVAVELAAPAEATTVVRRVESGGSYASARDPRVLVRLPPGASLAGVEVRWVDGRVERFDDIAPGGYRRLVQGEGR